MARDATKGIATLQAHDVHVSFGGITALAGVNLNLATGCICGLIGPNGAGKTTMVNVLSGFQQPTRGSVRLDGKAVVEGGPAKAARAGVARTFQAGRLFRDLTVQENLTVAALSAGLRTRAARERSAEILDWLGCGDMAGQRCDALSYGQERRIGIGRALALAPVFALLDEPASGLNDVECDSLMSLIADMPARFGCGVLLIEHNMHVIMNTCQVIHVLDGGRSLAEGTPHEIQANSDVRRAYLGHQAADPAWHI